MNANSWLTPNVTRPHQNEQRLAFSKGGGRGESTISRRIALTTFLWEISNRTKTSVPTRQNTLKQQTNNCRRGRKHSSYEDSWVMAYDTWNADGNMIICITGVIFIKASWSFFFLCFRKGKSGTDKEKKARNIKEEKMQESKNQGSNCKSKTKDWEVGQTSAMWSENCSEVK